MSSNGDWLGKKVEDAVTAAATSKLDDYVKGHKTAVEESRSMGRTPPWGSEMIANTYDTGKPMIRDGIRHGVRAGKDNLPRLAVTASVSIASLYSMNSPPESGWRGGSHTTGTQYDEPPEPYTDAGIVNLPYSPPDSPGPNGSEHSGCNYRDSGDSDLLGALSSRCSRPRSALFLSSDSDNASNPQELSIPSPFASPRSDYSAKGGLSEPYQSIHNVLDQTELERQRQGGTSVLSQSPIWSPGSSRPTSEQISFDGTPTAQWAAAPSLVSAYPPPLFIG